MPGSRILKRDLQERPTRAWICVLLALLILYNPFAALSSSYASYSVHGQARHRATVGASELQHLGCAQDQTKQDLVDMPEFLNQFAGAISKHEAIIPEEDVEVTQPNLVNRIWSRPPPLA